MKLASLSLVALALALPAFAQTQEIATWDPVYDDPNHPVSETACGTVIPANYSTFGSLPNFYHIGGMRDVTWGSSLCGSCWNITYGNVFVTFLAIDHLDTPDVNLSNRTMRELVGDTYPRVQVTVEQIDRDICWKH